MSHSNNNLWIHLVWSTKEKCPFFTKDILDNKVLPLIKEIAIKEGYQIDAINGYKDHIHCLLLLPNSVSLSTLVKKLKGKSSFLINENEFFKNKFQWGIGYFAVSVSPRFINSTRSYISAQWEKHEKLSLDAELDYFESLTVIT
ncbi:IS200/IS605 family transposase [Flammeovirga aprica]|uniref:IS200/IS605 family transposase n=1 Tax=Flammeovirga aprica JL-4 TaxID=694437 RepID=A0A7X9XBI6_9BACT|nr:IS200/IS605 family transposase [Flammeovirga aprica]NME70664.1 IS200/IS605 family transposase [Flammeovirga aprica JL-4]